MKFPRNAKIFRGRMDAAPFLGVFFLLVIFLVFSSHLVFTPGILIDLPETGSLSGINTPTLVVAVDRNGQYYYENQALREERLRHRLEEDAARYKTPATLVIQADKSVPYDVLVRLATLAREAGIQEALLATRPKVFSPAALPSTQP